MSWKEDGEKNGVSRGLGDFETWSRDEVVPDCGLQII